ncbi:MAG TPA: DUF1684 domain-containing protein [Anaerolineales bacterium]|nr:DUF1684 domain-containing protein [Anaerolineales bacterium]
MPTPHDPIALADWRRSVAELYANVREVSRHNPVQAWHEFRLSRDQLFKRHPSTPLSLQQRQSFTALSYYPYDPGWRLNGGIDLQVPQETFELELPGDGLLRYTRVARICFTRDSREASLSLFWLEGYGGGLFLPFMDATNGKETFGGGRYLYDTIKGADLGIRDDQVVLDFNFAYNPSCAYDDRWVCPLPLEENRLPFPVRAGENLPSQI